MLRALYWVAIAAGVASAQPGEELRTLMRQSLRNLQEADAQLADYGYDRYSVRREFTSSGGVKSQRTILARREFIDGEGFIQQVQRDGKPIPAAELKREQDAFRQRRAEIQAMTPAERARIAEEDRRKRQEETSWLKEFPDALHYRKVGEEMVDGRMAIVLECEPRPGYKASNLRARVFAKVRGKVWIDQADTQIVRVDAQVFDDVNVGWGMAAKVRKGTQFHAERRRLEDGAWLPTEQTVRFAARLLLVKSLSQEEATRYSGYRHKSALVASRE